MTLDGAEMTLEIIDEERMRMIWENFILKSRYVCFVSGKNDKLGVEVLKGAEVVMK